MSGTSSARLRAPLALSLALAALLAAVLAPGAAAREAYVTNFSGKLAVIDTATDQLGAPIPVGEGSEGIAITPDGRFAYVANSGSEDVSVVDTGSHAVAAPIALPAGPSRVAVTPDGKFVYVTEFNGGSVSVINTQTNQVEGPPIKVAHNPSGIAITPNGRFAFVAQANGESVSVIDTQTRSVLGEPIKVGSLPTEVAITPDGRFAYVNNRGDKTVSVIDTQTDIVGPPIAIPEAPQGLAITPDGRFVFVGAGSSSGQVYRIDTLTNKVVGQPIPAGNQPLAIAFTPYGAKAFVVNLFGEQVSVIDAQADRFIESVGPIAPVMEGIAITPDQPPHATFTVPDGRPGVPIALDASASSDPDGSIARYDWTFGDGTGESGGDAQPDHVYRRPGDYKVTLTLTDTEGCSTALVFTGQTANCNGSPTATQTQAVSVSYPSVRLGCPRSAGRRGCRFALQAVTKKHRGRSESAVAKARSKAGGIAVIGLRAKKAYALRLAAAHKVLVREKLTIRGRTRARLAQLKIVR